MGDKHQNGLRTLAGLSGAEKMSLGGYQTSIKLLACCSKPFHKTRRSTEKNIKPFLVFT